MTIKTIQNEHNFNKMTAPNFAAPMDASVTNAEGNTEGEATTKALENNHIEDMFSKAISNANKRLAPMSVEFQYQIHEKTGYVNLKIINTDTKEIIREIPSEKALDMLAKAWELAGIIVDNKK